MWSSAHIANFMNCVELNLLFQLTAQKHVLENFTKIQRSISFLSGVYSLAERTIFHIHFLNLKHLVVDVSIRIEVACLNLQNAAQEFREPSLLAHDKASLALERVSSFSKISKIEISHISAPFTNNYSAKTPCTYC